jgi:hypothetical protein
MHHNDPDHLLGDKVIEVGNGKRGNHARDCILRYRPCSKCSMENGLGVNIIATAYASSDLALEYRPSLILYDMIGI